MDYQVCRLRRCLVLRRSRISESYPTTGSGIREATLRHNGGKGTISALYLRRKVPEIDSVLPLNFLMVFEPYIISKFTDYGVINCIKIISEESKMCQSTDATKGTHHYSQTTRSTSPASSPRPLPVVRRSQGPSAPEGAGGGSVASADSAPDLGGAAQGAWHRVIAGPMRFYAPNAAGGACADS